MADINQTIADAIAEAGFHARAKEYLSEPQKREAADRLPLGNRQMTPRMMTAVLFRAWLNKHHLSDVDAARELGCRRETVARYRTGKTKIPLYIALACAIVAQGLQATR